MVSSAWLCTLFVFEMLLMKASNLAALASFTGPVLYQLTLTVTSSNVFDKTSATQFIVIILDWRRAFLLLRVLALLRGIRQNTSIS